MTSKYLKMSCNGQVWTRPLDDDHTPFRAFRNGVLYRGRSRVSVGPEKNGNVSVNMHAEYRYRELGADQEEDEFFKDRTVTVISCVPSNKIEDPAYREKLFDHMYAKHTLSSPYDKIHRFTFNVIVPTVMGALYCVSKTLFGKDSRDLTKQEKIRAAKKRRLGNMNGEEDKQEEEPKNTPSGPLGNVSARGIVLSLVVYVTATSVWYTVGGGTLSALLEDYFIKNDSFWLMLLALLILIVQKRRSMFYREPVDYVRNHRER